MNRPASAKRKGKIRWGALASFAVTVTSAVAPFLVDAVTAKHAVAGAVVGAVLQAVTKPVARKEYERGTIHPR